MTNLRQILPTFSVRRQTLFIYGFILALALLLGGGRAALAGELTILVDRTDDTATPAAQACTAAANDCSLRGAIMKANADPTNIYTITFPGGPNTYTLTRDNETPDDESIRDLDVMVNMMIRGSGADSTVIDANGYRAIHIHNGATVLIEGVSITNGVTYDAEGGGGILNEGTWLAVRDSYLGSNQAESYGGAIASYGNYLNIDHVTFEQNSSNNGDDGNNLSTECGGALYIFEFGTVVISRSKFTENEAQWGGGAVCQNGGEVTVRDSTFDGNTSLGAAATDTGGGAFYTNDSGFSSTSTIVRSTFIQNESRTGGAIRSNSNSSSSSWKRRVNRCSLCV